MPLCSSGSSAFGPLSRRPLQRKVVVVGDGGCGKALPSYCAELGCRLNVFTRGFFTQIYEPTVFENYVHDITVNDQVVELSLWDTAGQEDFDRLRSLSYAETHVIMLCFSVDSPSSLANVESKWIDEILEYCPGVKKVLKSTPALKCDLRDDHDVRERLISYHQRPVEYEEGLAVARRIRASRYLECSSKHNRGVDQVFYEAARCSISARKKGTGHWCSIM
ncbi:small GTPase superfamily [Hysterangium stoloniferum]|nr:small GTPase superfamily [Hysterangium stoloniferum]